MARKKLSPGTLAGVSKGSGIGSSLTYPIHIAPALSLQAKSLVRRFGLQPICAELIASLAFGE